jgi:hypothetical protein
MMPPILPGRHVPGTFPGTEGVLFPGVSVTTSLLAPHSGARQALAGQRVRHWPSCLPGNWVPH